MGVSLSSPVFVDCEASDLDGYIIEVGWAVAPQGQEIISAAVLVRPAPQWKIRDAWNHKAEMLHGISLVQLLAHGRSAEDVAQIVNEELAGLELFSDAPKYDGRWLAQLFEAAGVEPAFTISPTPTRALLETIARRRNFDPIRFQQRWDDARQNRRHRADADALTYARLWRLIMDDTRT